MAKKPANDTEKVKKAPTEKQLAARERQKAKAAEKKAAGKVMIGVAGAELTNAPAPGKEAAPGTEAEAVAPDVERDLYELIIPEHVPFAAIAINLDSSGQRRAHIVDQLTQGGLTFCLQKAQEAKENTNAGRLYASLYSHVKVLKGIAEGNINLPIIVLEDDATLHQSFYHHAAAALLELSDEWDVAFFGYLQHGSEVATINTGTWKQFEEPNFAGAYCYAINGKRAAEKILAAAPEDFKEGMDTLLQQLIVEGKIVAWFKNQQIAYHTSGLETTIWENR